MANRAQRPSTVDAGPGEGKAMHARKRKLTGSKRWVPEPGKIASYTGNDSVLLQEGTIVRVVAEATRKCMVVQAIDCHGRTVTLTLATKNLQRPQPGLFD